jgi:DNA-binding LacI/PurR family transcriptional regulator
MKEPVTIKSIAKELNISASTVSRALKDHPDIHRSTKEMVREAAQRLGFQPNAVAQGLRNRRTFTLGVIVPQIAHSFFAQILSGIEEATSAKGYNVLISQSNELYGREVACVKNMLSHQVDGIMMSLSQQTFQHTHLFDIQAKNTPLVLFDRVHADIQTTKVVIDDYRSAFLLVEHLIEVGYRRIALILGSNDIKICEDRLAGYLDALRKHDFPTDPSLIVRTNLDEKGAQKSMEQLLQLPKIPDAVFAITDTMAFGAFQAIKTQGYRIPEQIGLVSFNNDPKLAWLDTPFTTIEQPAYEMGRRAALLCIEQIETGVSFQPQTEILPSNLLIRASTTRNQSLADSSLSVLQATY